MTFTLSPCVVLPTIFSALNFSTRHGKNVCSIASAVFINSTRSSWYTSNACVCVLAIRSHPFKYRATQRYLKRDVACEEIKKKPGSTDGQTRRYISRLSDMSFVCIRLALNALHKYDGNMLDIRSSENVKRNDNEHVDEDWISRTNFTYFQRKYERNLLYNIVENDSRIWIVTLLRCNRSKIIYNFFVNTFFIVASNC